MSSSGLGRRQSTSVLPPYQNTALGEMAGITHGKGGGERAERPVTLRMDDTLFESAVQGRHIRKAGYLSF